MKLILIVFFAFLSGCMTPIPGYNFRGEVPEPSVVSASFVRDFASRFAREAKLRIVDQTKLTGNEQVDEIFSVHLRPESDAKVFVTVTAHIPTRMLFVRVAGDVDSAMAKDIAQRAQSFYGEMYHGAKLTPFTSHQGLFGP